MVIGPLRCRSSGYAAYGRCRRLPRRNGQQKPPAERSSAWRYCFVTADTQYCDVDMRWLKRSWIVRMLSQRAVTGLARNPGVHALALHFVNIGVAALTGRVAGKHHRTGGDIRKGGAPIKAILPKAARHKDLAQDEEQDDPHGEDRCHPEKVPCVLKICHRCNRE